MLILGLSTAVLLFGFTISLRFTNIIAASLYSETVIGGNFHYHNIIILFIYTYLHYLFKLEKECPKKIVE